MLVAGFWGGRYLTASVMERNIVAPKMIFCVDVLNFTYYFYINSHGSKNPQSRTAVYGFAELGFNMKLGFSDGG